MIIMMISASLIRVIPHNSPKYNKTKKTYSLGLSLAVQLTANFSLNYSKPNQSEGEALNKFR
jgi:hypothetical protein